MRLSLLSILLRVGNRIEIGDISTFQLPSLSTFTPSNWLPPRTSSDSLGVEMIEASRTKTLVDQPVQPIFPPLPDLQIQFDQVGIQSVPEPSTLSLGSLAFGLIALVRLNRRQKFLKH
jgi:hypothetical protein